jgi:hypothetical protein
MHMTAESAVHTPSSLTVDFRSDTGIEEKVL